MTNSEVFSLAMVAVEAVIQPAQSRSILSGRILAQPLRAGTNEGTVRDAIIHS